jgi:hypothetical protein
MLVDWLIMEDTKSPGTQANEQFVEASRNQYPELAGEIPEGCQDCSSAWLQAIRGRSERLQDCPGRSVIQIGELSIMACHLPKPAEV